MAEPARPYTPETLAQRWSCSSQHVRDLVSAGRLRAFRVGRLIRIKREEVERFEACQENANSGSTAVSGASTGEKAAASLDDALWAQRTARKLSAGSGI